VSASGLTIEAAPVFAWETLSARLERFEVAAPITFLLVGVLPWGHPSAPASAHPPCLVTSHAGVAAHHRCGRVIRGG